MSSRSSDTPPGAVPSLPQPQPPADPVHDPFVGNETADDNLAEHAQIAMWNAIGDADRSVTLSVKDSIITLKGEAGTDEQRDAIEAAIGRVPGVRGVIDSTTVLAARESIIPEVRVRGRKGIPPAERVTPRPFVHIVRFCSLDEASMSAALRQGIGTLDAFLTTLGLPPAETLIVIYRNLLAETITLEIGVPVDAATALHVQGEIKAGTTPGGPTMSLQIDEGLEGLLNGLRQLELLAKKARRRSLNYWWQSFAAESFRPWQGHPAAALRLPVRQGAAIAANRPASVERGRNTRREP